MSTAIEAYHALTEAYRCLDATLAAGDDPSASLVRVQELFAALPLAADLADLDAASLAGLTRAAEAAEAARSRVARALHDLATRHAVAAADAEGRRRNLRSYGGTGSIGAVAARFLDAQR